MFPFDSWTYVSVCSTLPQLSPFQERDHLSWIPVYMALLSIFTIPNQGKSILFKLRHNWGSKATVSEI